MNVLMRLKNKIREKFFWDRILTDPDPPDSSMHSATGSHQHDKESDPLSHPDFQFYDAMDGSEPENYAFGQTFTEMLLQGGEGAMLDYAQRGSSVPSHEQPEAFLTLNDFDMDAQQQPWPPVAAEMDLQRDLPYWETTPAVPVYAEFGGKEEYVDARMELPEDSSAASASQLSRVETTEMVDTGESSAAALQPAQWQQLMLIRQFLEIDGVDGGEQASAGWRVILSIVSAFRRISGLVRTRRLQRTTSEQTAVSTPRRIGPSPRYKGIRQRNGKWVSEIRIGGTLEKVWLGSYNTEKEAALAFDAGKHHCSARKSRNFNFADSPRLLGAPENLMHLSSVERRTRIKRLAEDHARTYGNAHIR